MHKVFVFSWVQLVPIEALGQKTIQASEKWPMDCWAVSWVRGVMYPFCALFVHKTQPAPMFSWPLLCNEMLGCLLKKEVVRSARGFLCTKSDRMSPWEELIAGKLLMKHCQSAELFWARSLISERMAGNYLKFPQWVCFEVCFQRPERRGNSLQLLSSRRQELFSAIGPLWERGCLPHAAFQMVHLLSGACFKVLLEIIPEILSSIVFPLTVAVAEHSWSVLWLVARILYDHRV